MTPEYIRELADLADPDKLWRLAGMDQIKLPPEKRGQLDTGVALRRHARDVETLRELPEGASVLYTPLPGNGRRTQFVPTPGTTADAIPPLTPAEQAALAAFLRARDRKLDDGSALMECYDAEMALCDVLRLTTGADRIRDAFRRRHERQRATGDVRGAQATQSAIDLIDVTLMQKPPELRGTGG